jgi:hypothetical protein
MDDVDAEMPSEDVDPPGAEDAGHAHDRLTVSGETHAPPSHRGKMQSWLHPVAYAVQASQCQSPQSALPPHMGAELCADDAIDADEGAGHAHGRKTIRVPVHSPLMQVGASHRRLQNPPPPSHSPHVPDPQSLSA